MSIFSGSSVHRFRAKTIAVPELGDHWIWIGAVSDDGYGRFTLNSESKTQSIAAHRFAFAAAHDVPLDSFGPLMHTCDIPLCVHATSGTDSHLVEGTIRANMLDRQRKGRDNNGSRWRGLSRREVADRSRALRDELLAYGTDHKETIIALLSGHDPLAPRLF